ncbi:TRAP transporter substrate-binding protein [Pueribacillus theae]|uniref:TRAP transporter substrate-binding protein n=1 Tax=Pueribacillus theae TaxID=2171751 RepID=A0A2U1K241_9BACI|nr:TAXI family TRAP transporter solute-binding subunit [Pueribacillus theae]PWA11053.1 TRAP transporter substrate-binding protein [Pueribacillus theae]
MFKKKYGLLSFLLMLTLLALAACGGGGGDETANENEGEKEKSESKAGGTVDLLMGTGSQGGTYFPLGAEMANVWNKNIDNVNVTSTESGASVENLAKIWKGEFDLGMTVNLPAYDAMNGVGDFEGKKVENFAFIGHIYPEVLQIVTRESTGINSIEDLKGKRVAIGPPGSGTQTATKIVLEAFGIKDGDYEAYQEGFGDAKSKLQDGTIDASFGLLGLPDAGIDELQASVKDVKFLPVTDEAIKYIEENSGYSSYTIPAGSYEWQEEDISAVSAFAVLVANTDKVDDDLAYQLAKVMIENADENTHPQAKHMTKENALNGLGDLPLHPGAEKYYEEAGIK